MFEGDVRVLAPLRKECSVPEAVDAGRAVQVARLKEVRPDLLDHLRETEAYFCSASVTDLHYWSPIAFLSSVPRVVLFYEAALLLCFWRTIGRSRVTRAIRSSLNEALTQCAKGGSVFSGEVESRITSLSRMTMDTLPTLGFVRCLVQSCR